MEISIIFFVTLPKNQKIMDVQFVVRYANGLKDTVVQVGLHDDVVSNMPTGYIRKHIRDSYPELANKRLKLLHNGRVLLSHTNFSKEISYLSKNLDDDEEEPNEEETQRQDTPVKIYFHCIVGDELSPAELKEEEQLDQQPIKTTTEAPKGFDRLLSQGFSPTDIQDLRNQFLRLHGSNLPANANSDQIHELEDRWIDSSVNHEIDEFPANMRFNFSNGSNENNSATSTSNGGLIGQDENEDEASIQDSSINNMQPTANNMRQQLIQRDVETHRETFLGVCVGFTLGGLALLLLFLNVGGIFSKRTRMAVISGVVVNFSFGLFRSWTG